MNLLLKHNLSFDLGVTADQLPMALNLVQAAPENRYMLDHLGKPAISKGEFDRWKKVIVEISKNPNVYCKLSGLVTEAHWEQWTIADLQPYVDVVLEYFGAKRLAFGGDWPVVTLASDYKRWLDSALQLCSSLDQHDINRVFYQNALDFYQIEDTHEQL